MMSPLRDAFALRAAHLRVIDDIDTEAPGGLADDDEAALIAAELDRLDTELLAVGQRLERLGTALAAALNVTDREPALAGV